MFALLKEKFIEALRAVAPLIAIAGGARDSALYKVFMVACVLAFLAAVAVYFTREGSRPLAIASLLLTGLWLEVGYVTNAVMPDAAFCAFVWAIFCLGDRAGPNSPVAPGVRPTFACRPARPPVQRPAQWTAVPGLKVLTAVDPAVGGVGRASGY